MRRVAFRLIVWKSASRTLRGQGDLDVVAAPSDRPVIVEVFARWPDGLGLTSAICDHVRPRPSSAPRVTIHLPSSSMSSPEARSAARFSLRHSTRFRVRVLLDLNRRVHTSHPLAVTAGVNLVGACCDLLRGEEMSAVRARPEVFFRWLKGDVRHLFKAVRLGQMSAGQALRELRPRRGTSHSSESRTVPGPMFNRLWYAGRRVAEGVRDRDAA